MKKHNITSKVIITSFMKKLFVSVLILFIIFSVFAVITNSPTSSSSISLTRFTDCSVNYSDNTYHIRIFYYHSTCGKPVRGANATLKFGPLTNPVKNYANGNKIFQRSAIINSTGTACISFKSNRTWIMVSDLRQPLGSYRRTLLPINTSESPMYYTPVYDHGFAYEGYLELIYLSACNHKAPVENYRLVESDNRTINIGNRGNFTYMVIPLSYPPTTTDIYGTLQWKINDTWTDRGLNVVSTANNESASFTYLLYAVPNSSKVTMGVFDSFAGFPAIVMSLFIILLGIFTFSIPVSSGQAEFILSLPVKRAHYFTGKYIAILISIFLLVILGIIGSFEFVKFTLGTYPVFTNVITLFTIMVMLLTVSLSLTFLFASRGKNIAKMFFYPLASVLFLYFIYGGMITSIYAALKDMAVVSGQQNIVVRLFLMADPFTAFNLYNNSLYTPPNSTPVHTASLFEFIPVLVLWILIPLALSVKFWLDHRQLV